MRCAARSTCPSGGWSSGRSPQICGTGSGTGWPGAGTGSGTGSAGGTGSGGGAGSGAGIDGPGPGCDGGWGSVPGTGCGTSATGTVQWMRMREHYPPVPTPTLTGRRAPLAMLLHSQPPTIQEDEMQIAVIGAGNIGATLTRRLTALGHDVTVANSRGPGTLQDLATETGATAADVTDAARGAELVVVTIPLGHVPDLPDDLLAATAPGAVIVDTGNYYPQRDGRIDAILEGTTESRWTARQLGHPVVKAFNNIYAAHLLTGGRPSGDPARFGLPVAGDEEAATRTVMDLVDALGFDPVDAGPIDESWRQQPGSVVYGTDLPADALRRALADQPPGRPAEFTP